MKFKDLNVGALFICADIIDSQEIIERLKSIMKKRMALPVLQKILIEDDVLGTSKFTALYLPNHMVYKEFNPETKIYKLNVGM